MFNCPEASNTPTYSCSDCILFISNKSVDIFVVISSNVVPYTKTSILALAGPIREAVCSVSFTIPLSPIPSKLIEGASHCTNAGLKKFSEFTTLLPT